MQLSKSNMEFLGALARIFIQRIDADEHFKMRRIEEWCRKMPTPPMSNEGSTDIGALEQIQKLHLYLCEMDCKHSSFGNKWPSSVVRTFLQSCEQLKSIVTTSAVEKSIYNLYHYHRAICHRSMCDFQTALNEIRLASQMIRQFIESNPPQDRWPRYSRNVIINKGHESDILRRDGQIARALSASDEMLLLAEQYTMNAGFVAWERKENLPSVRSWALYYACEAHLAVEEWDDPKCRQDREYVFSMTFSQRHHMQWTTPTLIQILRNDAWRERYPHFFEQIADRAYVGAATSRSRQLLRQTSILCGRIRLMPAPALLAGLVLIGAAFLVDNSRPTISDKSDIIHILDEALAGERQNFPELSDVDVDEMRDAIINDFDVLQEALKNEENWMEVALTLSAAETESGEGNVLDWTKLPVASNGNEQGVGPGMRVT